MDNSLSAAQVRFVEVSPGTPEMDFYVNGAGAAYNVGYANFTSYLPVSPGVSAIGVNRAGTNVTVAGTQGNFSGGHQYTAVVSRRFGSLQTRVYQDQDTPAPPGRIAVRVVNEMEGQAPVTVYVAPADSGGPAPAPPIALSVPSGTPSLYLDLPASATYTVSATVAESGLNLPVSSVTLKAPAGAVRTVIFAGTAQAGSHASVGFALNDLDTPESAR